MIETFALPPPLAESKKKRKVYVYLPDDLEEEMRLPVLYMFDGHNLFSDSEATYGKSWGLSDFLEANHVPLMVVGVDCNHSKNHGRLRENSPFSFDDPDLGHITGKGKQTMAWFTGPLKAYIDEHYPTLPMRETTFIAGSSMGGLMTLYALCCYGDTYSRGAALSPSLWTSRRCMQMIRQSDTIGDSVLYMDYGENELARHEGMRTLFGQVAGALLEKGTKLNLRIVPGGEHCEASWEEQIPFFMDTLFYEGFRADRSPDPED